MPPGPSVFGDERDSVLMHFNLLQACSGMGKGIVTHEGTTQLIDFNSEAVVCRFKVCKLFYCNLVIMLLFVDNLLQSLTHHKK